MVILNLTNKVIDYYFINPFRMRDFHTMSYKVEMLVKNSQK